MQPKFDKTHVFAFRMFIITTYKNYKISLLYQCAKPHSFVSLMYASGAKFNFSQLFQDHILLRVTVKVSFLLKITFFQPTKKTWTVWWNICIFIIFVLNMLIIFNELLNYNCLNSINQYIYSIELSLVIKSRE